MIARQRRHRDAAMRLRGRAESRSRSRNRNKSVRNQIDANGERDLKAVKRTDQGSDEVPQMYYANYGVKHVTKQSMLK